jgi:hypothetical protein
LGFDQNEIFQQRSEFASRRLRRVVGPVQRARIMLLSAFNAVAERPAGSTKPFTDSRSLLQKILF